MVNNDIKEFLPNKDDSMLSNSDEMENIEFEMINSYNVFNNVKEVFNVKNRMYLIDKNFEICEYDLGLGRKIKKNLNLDRCYDLFCYNENYIFFSRKQFKPYL